MTPDDGRDLLDCLARAGGLLAQTWDCTREIGNVLGIVGMGLGAGHGYLYRFEDDAPGDAGADLRAEWRASDGGDLVLPEALQLGQEGPRALPRILRRDATSLVVSSERLWGLVGFGGRPQGARWSAGELRAVAALAANLAICFDRRAARNRIRDTEALRGALAQALPDLVFVMGADHQFIECHAADPHALYAPPDQIIGKHITGVLPPDLAELCEGLLDQAQATGRVQAAEYVLSIGGEDRHFEARIAPLQDGRFTVVVRDITELARMLRRHELSSGYLAAVLRAAGELIDCPDEDTLHRRAVEIARGQLGVERCAIFLNEGETVRGTYGTDRHGRTVDERNHRFPIDDFWRARFGGWRESTVAWQVISDEFSDWQGDHTEVFGEGEIAVTPVSTELTTTAVFVNDNALSGRPLDHDVQQVVAVYCSTLASIIDRKRTAASLEKANLRLQTLNSISRTISESQSAEQLAESLAHALRAALPVDAFVLQAYDRETEVAVNVGRYDTIEGEFVGSSTSAVQSVKPGGPLDTILKTRRALIIDRRQGHRALTQLQPFGDTQRLSESLLFTPLISAGEVIGLLSVQSYTPGVYGPSETEFLEDVSRQLAPAMETLLVLRRLAEGQRELSTLMSNLPGMAYRCQDRPLWPMQFVSEGCHELTGYTAEDLTSGSGPLYGELIVEEHRAMVEDAVRRGVEADTHFQMTYRIRCADGREKDVWERGRAVPLPGGRHVLEGFIADISEQVAAAQRHAALSAGLREIVRIADELIACPDMDTMLRCAVELPRKALSLDRASLFLDDGDVVVGTYGTDRDGNTTDERGVRLERNEYWTSVLRPPTPDEGTWREVPSAFNDLRDGNVEGFGQGRVAVAPVANGDIVIGVFCNDNAISGRPLDNVSQEVVAVYCSLLANIIERRRVEEALRVSESRFRQMAALLPDMIYETDPQLRIEYANEAALRALGYTADDITAGLSLMDVVAQDDRARAMDSLRRIANTNETSVGYYDVLCKDGTPVPCEINSVMVQAADGSFAGFRGVLRDISQRRQAEQAQRMAAIGQLAAGVAHEFNNLLAIMRGRAEFAAAVGNDAEYRALVDATLRASERGAAITRNLMSFARPSEPKRKPMHIEDAINQAVALAERELERNGIECVRSYRTRGRRVFADAGQLQEVFLNLIVNAIHAMGPGGTLTIAARHEEDNWSEGTIVVGVSDTGCGIPPEHISRVFEPFFTTKGRLGESSVPGTGLGLSLTHGIIEAHGGIITVSSVVGSGTTFEITLKVYGGPDGEPVREAEEPVLAPRLSRQGGRVLVAEDECELRELLSAVLTAQGYAVTTHSRGSDAIAHLQQFSVDLVISDLLMPGGGGREILEAARATDANPPVVLVTGRGEDGLAESLLAAGANRLFTKPVKLAALLEAVRELLDTPSSAEA